MIAAHELRMNAAELLNKAVLKETSFQLYWPCQFDPEIKLPGPNIKRVEGNYWIVEGFPDRKYSRLEELVGDLAYMEEIRRMRVIQEDFDNQIPTIQNKNTQQR